MSINITGAANQALGALAVKKYAHENAAQTAALAKGVQEGANQSAKVQQAYDEAVANQKLASSSETNRLESVYSSNLEKAVSAATKSLDDSYTRRKKSQISLTLMTKYGVNYQTNPEAVREEREMIAEYLKSRSSRIRSRYMLGGK